MKGAILRLGLYDYGFFKSWCADGDKVMIQKSGTIVKAFSGERPWPRSGRRGQAGRARCSGCRRLRSRGASGRRPRRRGWGRVFPDIRAGWAWRGAWPRPARRRMRSWRRGAGRRRAWSRSTRARRRRGGLRSGWRDGLDVWEGWYFVVLVDYTKIRSANRSYRRHHARNDCLRRRGRGLRRAAHCGQAGQRAARRTRSGLPHPPSHSCMV